MLALIAAHIESAAPAPSLGKAQHMHALQMHQDGAQSLDCLEVTQLAQHEAKHETLLCLPAVMHDILRVHLLFFEQDYFSVSSHGLFSITNHTIVIAGSEFLSVVTWSFNEERFAKSCSAEHDCMESISCILWCIFISLAAALCQINAGTKHSTFVGTAVFHIKIVRCYAQGSLIGCSVEQISFTASWPKTTTELVPFDRSF